MAIRLTLCTITSRCISAHIVNLRPSLWTLGQVWLRSLAKSTVRQANVESTLTICTQQSNQTRLVYMTARPPTVVAQRTITAVSTRVTPKDLDMKASLPKMCSTLERSTMRVLIHLNIPLAVFTLKPSTSTVKMRMESWA